MLQLHDYQKRAIEFGLKRKQVYFAVDMGLGKTAISLKCIEAVGKPALVFGPLRPILTTWPEEIQKWTPKLKCVTLHGIDKNTKLHNLTQPNTVYLLNYEGIKWFYNKVGTGRYKVQPFFTIFDEASALKAHNTQRFKMLQKMMPIFSNYRFALSATPSPNGLWELWSQYYMLDQGVALGKYFTPFRNKYFIYNERSYKTYELPGAKEAIYKEIQPRTFRLDATDYLNMPDIIYNQLTATLSPSLFQAYKKFAKEFFLQFKDGEEVVVRNAATMSNKLRQFTQGAIYTTGSGNYQIVHNTKAAILKNFLEEVEGQPILCPINFKFELDMIQKELGKQIPVIHGSTDARTSMRLIREWNQGSLPLLLCHPQSLSHGVNLQAGGHIILWYGLPWSLEQYTQLNGRLHRQGQRKGVVVNHIMLKNTVDELIMRTLQSKNASQQDLLNNLRRYAEIILKEGV